MDLLRITTAWMKPALGVATALTMAAPFAPSALSCEQDQTQTQKDKLPLKEQTTQFVPEDHKGVVCMAVAPQCMTKKQWAAYCLSETNLMTSKSCRDALDQSAPNPEES
jgi:hypothetical protein